MHATPGTVENTLAAEGVQRVEITTRSYDDRRGRGSMPVGRRMDKSNPDSHEHRRRTRGRSYACINPATLQPYQCPFLDGPAMRVPNLESTWLSIYQVYTENEWFRGYFNQRYAEVLGNQGASDEFLHEFDRRLLEARDGAITIPERDRRQRFSYTTIHQSGS